MLPLVLALVVAFGQSGPGGQAAKPAPAADEVTAQTRRYFDAVKRNDADALNAMLAQDYVEVSPLGQVDHRKQIIEFYRLAARAQTGQSSELSAVRVDDVSVHVYGDVAVAVVGESFTLSVLGKPVDRPMRSTLVWQRIAGSWKLVSSHHTTIRPPIGPADARGGR